MAHLLQRDDTLARVLRETRSVAILGASRSRWKAGFYVPDYLELQGYAVYPVNPSYEGDTLWGQPVRPTLNDIPVPIDMVDVFRRPETLPGHVDEILAMTPLPKVVWLQQGIRHAEFTATLLEAGIDVVEDRCTLAVHRRHRIEPHRP